MEHDTPKHFPTDEEMKDPVVEALTRPVSPWTVEQQLEDKDLPQDQREIAARVLRAVNEGYYGRTSDEEAAE